MNTNKKICDFCNEIENCNPELHHPVQLRILLVDANIIEDTYEAWNEWLITPIPEAKILCDYSPNEIWNMGGKFVLAKYVRSIL